MKTTRTPAKDAVQPVSNARVKATIAHEPYARTSPLAPDDADLKANDDAITQALTEGRWSDAVRLAKAQDRRRRGGDAGGAVLIGGGAG